MLACQQVAGSTTLVEPEEGTLLCGTEEALPETLSGSSQVLGMHRKLGCTQARGRLTSPASHESQAPLQMRFAPFSCTLWKGNPQRFSRGVQSDAGTGNTTGTAGRDGNRRTKKKTSRPGCAPRRLGNDHRSRHPLEAPSISTQSVESDSSDSSDTLLRQASMRNFGMMK